MAANGITSSPQALVLLRGPDVLPAEAEVCTRGCMSLEEFWTRLGRIVPHQQVVDTVQNLLLDMEPLREVTLPETT